MLELAQGLAGLDDDLLEYPRQNKRRLALSVSQKMETYSANDQVRKPEGDNGMKNALVTKRFAEGEQRIINHQPNCAEHEPPRSIRSRCPWQESERNSQ